MITDAETRHRLDIHQATVNEAYAERDRKTQRLREQEQAEINAIRASFRIARAGVEGELEQALYNAKTALQQEIGF